MRSVTVLWLTIALLIFATFQARRWSSLGVIDWDVAGYYAYLPSAFIYHDLGRADSLTHTMQRDSPTHAAHLELVQLANGNSISKYAAGVALTDVPWFWGAHLYAQATGQPATGFSRPYQQSIVLAGLVYAVLGLYILRKLLRQYFPDTVVAWTLAGVGLGTNLFCYASYEAAMAHAPLFLWQAALLYCTAQWHRTPKLKLAVGIGLFLGLATLTRPTEILYALLPLCWGISRAKGITSHLLKLGQYPGQLAAAGLVFTLIAGLQFLFWRVTSGSWVVYTYGEQGFNFADPHILDGLFSFRKGWLLYTPIIIPALLGSFWLRRYVPEALLPAMVVVPTVVFVTFCWDQWWYGGSFGARPLISLYPLLALPLASLVAAAQKHQTGTYRLLWAALTLCIVLNLLQTWQYHRAILRWDETTREMYFHDFLRTY